MGAPRDLIEMISNIYTGSFTQIRTSTGLTDNIPLLAGVKQGCPMSPILFNLSIELILRLAKKTANDIGPTMHHDTPLSILAYADNLVVMSRSRPKLQKILDAVSATATNPRQIRFPVLYQLETGARPHRTPIQRPTTADSHSL